MMRITLEEAKKDFDRFVGYVIDRAEPITIDLSDGRSVQLVPIAQRDEEAATKQDTTADAEKFMDDYDEDFQRLAR